MKVLADTCIWSEVLRRKSPDEAIKKRFYELIQENRVEIIGPIRQEILTGFSEIKQFNALKGHLAQFEDIPLKTEHFEKAAEFCNLCRQKGIQGSAIDFLICAVAFVENFIIFTTNQDFENYQKYLPLKLIK